MLQTLHRILSHVCERERGNLGKGNRGRKGLKDEGIVVLRNGKIVDIRDVFAQSLVRVVGRNFFFASGLVLPPPRIISIGPRNQGPMIIELTSFSSTNVPKGKYRNNSLSKTCTRAVRILNTWKRSC
jgi:hypothetical protein